MTSSYKLYIDPQGVKRGYYVYLHKDSATGEVFYVGKGYGKRAWDIKSRNSKWKSKVASLSGGWQVEIVQDDLSENEAFDLGISLIEKYGGPEAVGGKLTNEALGGESSLEINLGFQFDDNGWSQAYFDARLFKQFPREKEEVLVKEYNDSLRRIYQEINILEADAFDRDDEKLIEITDNYNYFVGNILGFNKDFLRRRISWKELAISIEDMIDDIECDLEDNQMYHGDTRSLLERLLKVASTFLNKINSGNKQEAEEIANRKTGRA